MFDEAVTACQVAAASHGGGPEGRPAFCNPQDSSSQSPREEPSGSPVQAPGEKPGVLDQFNMAVPLRPHFRTQGLGIPVLSPDSTFSVPPKPWQHSIPSRVALLLSLGFFQAADISCTELDALVQAMTTAAGLRLAHCDRKMLSGLWEKRLSRA